MKVPNTIASVDTSLGTIITPPSVSEEELEIIVRIQIITGESPILCYNNCRNIFHERHGVNHSDMSLENVKQGTNDWHISKSLNCQVSPMNKENVALQYSLFKEKLNRVIALLDQRSQRTYVLEKSVGKMDLKKILQLSPLIHKNFEVWPYNQR